MSLFGALSGLVASWQLRPLERAQDTELAQLRDEVRALRQELAVGRTAKAVASPIAMPD